MAKDKLKAIMTGFMLVFYFIIIMFMFFGVLKINELDNFLCALAFEILGFFLLAFFIFGNILLKGIKLGYFVPLVLVTVCYVVLLNILNMGLVHVFSSTMFALWNLILLFVYCLIAIPMFLMGRN